MPLQIKVGHRYRTRSGDVVEIIRFDATYKDLPFQGREVSEKGNVYTWWISPEGKVPLSNGKDAKDLIEEIPADVATP